MTNTYQELTKEHIKAKNRAAGDRFSEVPVKATALDFKNPPVKAWRNNKFFVQEYNDRGFIRLSILRTEVKGFRKGTNDPIWADGITWDELQQIKSQLGYGDRWMVEIFPPDSEVVNVANLRHLWLLDEPPEYGWHKQ